MIKFILTHLLLFFICTEVNANIAGKEAIKAWNIANRINGNKINTNASLNSLQWYNNQLSNLANYPNITDSKTLTPQSWYASQSPYAKSILESNTYNALLVNEVDRDNFIPAIIPPAISGGITAYRGYRFAQALNKSKDIIAKANPQSEEGKNSSANEAEKKKTNPKREAREKSREENKQHKGRPQNNQDQNSQVDSITNELGLTKDQRRKLHDENRKRGENLGYRELKDLAKELFNK